MFFIQKDHVVRLGMNCERVVILQLGDSVACGVWITVLIKVI